MSHYLTIPINENGIIFDPAMNLVVQDAIALNPFAFTDVFLYSHGWSTDAYRAMDEYNSFSIGLAKQILLMERLMPGVLLNPPKEALGVGVHWPSEITEDPNNVLNDLQLFTFYTMEHRADAVGKNAVYALLRLMLTVRAQGDPPLRFSLLGHSFGCKVICAALQDVWTDIDNGTIPLPNGTQFSAVLLQAATDNDNLEAGDIYGGVSKLPTLRLLATTSTLDSALGTWYPRAGKLANLLHPAPNALGSAGPTQNTIAAFGGSAKTVQVNAGFLASNMQGATGRLTVADLSPVHQARAASGQYSGGGIAGSHSDIDFNEVYQMVMGFLFGV
jgi:hypothetical protein